MELLLFSATVTAILMLSWGLFTLAEIHKELSRIRETLMKLATPNSTVARESPRSKEGNTALE
jgi:hypothetical protein